MYVNCLLDVSHLFVYLMDKCVDVAVMMVMLILALRSTCLLPAVLMIFKNKPNVKSCHLPKEGFVVVQ